MTRSSTGLPFTTEEGCIRPWATRAQWRSRKIGVASKRHWWHKSGAMGGVARGQGHSKNLDRPGRRRCRACVILLASTLAAWLGPSFPAKADEPEAAERAGWSFPLTPDIWGAGLKGDVGTRSNLPTAEIDASFGDIIENTDFAFMLVGEVRYGRWGVLADLAYLSIGADGTTPGLLFSGVET